MLADRVGASPVLIERSGPMGRLLALAAAVRHEPPPERPVVALVAGEAGIGKTRLVCEVGRAAGLRVLGGQADRGSLGRPLAVVADVLGGPPPAGEDPVRAGVDAVADRVGAGPAIVVFEDLHWADAESVAVFERLAARVGLRALLIATFRPEDLSRRLPGGEMLLRLERRQAVHRLQLDRLSRHGVAAFLAAVAGRPVPASTIDAFATRSGGNPFVLEELVRAAGDDGLEHHGRVPLPWTLAELVALQLEGLGPRERRVAETVAVLGPSASFDAVAAVAGLGEPELIEALRSLVGSGVLVEPRDDQFGFRHALVADAVAGNLLSRERRRLHQRALDALAGVAGPAELARHAAGAGRFDDQVALARLGVTQYLASGSSFAALVLATDALAEAPDDADLLGGTARVAWLSGQLDEAAGYADRWIAVAERTGDPTQLTPALRLRARVAWERQEHIEQQRLADRIAGLAGAMPAGEEQAWCLAALAQLHMLADRPVDAISWADRALDLAEAIGAHAVRVQALVERGSAAPSCPAGSPRASATCAKRPERPRRSVITSSWHGP